MQILPLFVRLHLTFQVLHFLVLLSSRVLPLLNLFEYLYEFRIHCDFILAMCK